MSQVVPTRRSTSREINKVEELVQQGMLEYNLNQHTPPQASCWLTETMPKKEMPPAMKGLNKKQRDREKKIALERQLTEINALAKKYKDSEKEFQNSNLKLNFKL